LTQPNNQVTFLYFHFYLSLHNTKKIIKGCDFFVVGQPHFWIPYHSSWRFELNSTVSIMPLIIVVNIFVLMDSSCLWLLLIFRITVCVNTITRT
jgi:hypothetical protein